MRLSAQYTLELLAHAVLCPDCLIAVCPAEGVVEEDSTHCIDNTDRWDLCVKGSDLRRRALAHSSFDYIIEEDGEDT